MNRRSCMCYDDYQSFEVLSKRKKLPGPAEVVLTFEIVIKFLLPIEEYNLQEFW